MVLLWVFAVLVTWFPFYGLVDSQATGLDYLVSLLWHLVLPVGALTMALFGQIYLVFRGAVQQVLGSDYVQAAVGRRLRDRLVASRYILRNALLPVVARFAIALGSLKLMVWLENTPPKQAALSS